MNAPRNADTYLMVDFAILPFLFGFALSLVTVGDCEDTVEDIESGDEDKGTSFIWESISVGAVSVWSTDSFLLPVLLDRTLCLTGEQMVNMRYLLLNNSLICDYDRNL